MQTQLGFNQINLIVRDVRATVDFYRRLGMPIEAKDGEKHVELELASGMRIEIDAADVAGVWDSGWRKPAGSPVVFGFGVASREAVDALFESLVAAGYRGRQPPYDAFWGARYAIVEDPDGNGAGIMSPVEADRKFWPPQPIPKMP